MDPELARIGLNEAEARDGVIAYRLEKVPMLEVLRTRTHSDTLGFMKALVEAYGDRIFGFTAFGAEAGKILAAFQVAMLGFAEGFLEALTRVSDGTGTKNPRRPR
jgi:pyruvate/2-oxoglutarate dehydrogenase complex dihydrolipoamide dehydrogenase (E3) component